MNKKLYYFFVALALVGVLAWVVTTPNQRIRRFRPTTGMVTAAAPEAFGAFTAGSLVGRSAIQAASPTANGTVSSTVGSAEKDIVAPSMTAVTLTYTGGVFEVPMLPVLRRDVLTSRSFLSDSLSGLLKYLSLSTFKKLQVDSLALTEQGSDGYSIAIDVQRGVTSLYRQSTDTIMKVPARPLTGTGVALTPGEAISIAHTFLTAHGISTEHLDAPIVQDMYSGITPMMISTDLLPFNSSVSVTFPWIIDGIRVVDQGGNPYGLQVSVDAATRQVSGASNIVDLRFTGSDYQLLSDVDAIIAAAQRGMYYPLVTSEGETAATVQLAKPTPVYMISSYQLSNDGADYLVPALWFPFTNIPPDAALYQQGEVIPLLSALLAPPETVPAGNAQSGDGSAGTTSSGSAVDSTTVAPPPSTLQ